MSSTFLRTLAVAAIAALTGCASQSRQIRRLSPLPETSQNPAQCRLVAVMPNSPAQRAGLRVGDVLAKVNGVTPTDAAAVTELITKSPDTAQIVVISTATPTGVPVSVSLNKNRPRLGAMCDLSGWRKEGVTAAGNESVTVFSGPYAATFSGIIDKGLTFLRVRVANNGAQPLSVSASEFTARDANGQSLTILSPKEVMCYLYGEKGAHLLTLKRNKLQSVDTDTGPKAEKAPDESCPAGTGSGAARGQDAQYAEANAEYMAAESLWPTSVKPGDMADGLIYLREVTVLPVSIEARVGEHTMTARLGSPQPQSTTMKENDLVRFFERQKRGNAIRITLKKGKVFVGKFASWDGINERVWFDTPASGLFNTTSFPLTGIRAAEALEQVPPKPAATVQDRPD